MHSIQVPTIPPHRVKFLPSLDRTRDNAPGNEEDGLHLANASLHIPPSLRKRRSKSTHRSFIHTPSEKFPLIDYFHKPPPLRSTRQRARLNGASPMQLLSYSGLSPVSPKGKQKKKSAMVSPLPKEASPPPPAQT